MRFLPLNKPFGWGYLQNGENSWVFGNQFLDSTPE